MADRFLIVDGNSILNRAYYAIRPMATREGIYTNAVLGTVNILWRHLEKLKPTYAAIAFDLPAPTFRHQLYVGYKASRKGMPDELAMQLPYIKQIAGFMGLNLVCMEGYEADDILGTLSLMAKSTGAHSFLITGDRDSLQLVDPFTTVLLATNTEDIEYTPEAVKERYGLDPDQLIDLKALMGDSSDEIPGVKGIGEKTAIKLMTETGSLDLLYVALDGGGLAVSPSIRQKLEAGRESAYMSQTLAAIKRDVPLDMTPEQIKLRPRDEAGLMEVFTQLELRSLIKKFGLDAPAPQLQPALKQKDDGQISFDLDGASDSSVPIPELDIKDIDKAKPVYAATDRRSGTIYVCQEGGATYRADPCSTALTSLLESGAPVVADDAKRLYGALPSSSKALDGADCAFDTSLAGYVLSPTDSDYSAAKLATRYLLLPSFEDGRGGVTLLGKLHDTLQNQLRVNGQQALYHNVELPLAFVLLDMERIGFMVDRAGIEAYGQTLSLQAQEIRCQIFELAGLEFNINSPKQLGEVLFEKLGLPSGKKTKTGRSTDAEVLEALAPQYPIVGKILEYRTLTKLISTYCEGLVKTISPLDGRIHSSFNQTVAATGRLSSTEPNLQNIPVRTKAGQQLRRYFIAREGCVLLDADYSQIELRLLAHISGDAELIKAFREGKDIHALTASEVFGVPIEQVTSMQRSHAKAVNFGIVYGIGETSLAQDIGVSRKEAAEYIAGYFRKYPGVKSYMEEIAQSARKKGYVETFMGRRRYIPELVSPKSQLVSFGERVARNTPIQGGAADIIKTAMVNVHRRLKKEGFAARLILQVHDELIIEAPECEAKEAAAILQYEMENTCQLDVRLVAEVNSGRSWYDAKG